MLILLLLICVLQFEAVKLLFNIYYIHLHQYYRLLYGIMVFYLANEIFYKCRCDSFLFLEGGVKQEFPLINFTFSQLENLYLCRCSYAVVFFQKKKTKNKTNSLRYTFKEQNWLNAKHEIANQFPYFLQYLQFHHLHPRHHSYPVSNIRIAKWERIKIQTKITLLATC